MPTLYILNGWKVQMFADETERPHFHLYRAGQEFRFSLADGLQLTSDDRPAPPGMARMARRWADRNRHALIIAWDVLRSGGVPDVSQFID